MGSYLSIQRSGTAVVPSGSWCRGITQLLISKRSCHARDPALPLDAMIVPVTVAGADLHRGRSASEYFDFFEMVFQQPVKDEEDGQGQGGDGGGALRQER